MKRIYVGNLSFGTTEQVVRSMFEQYGTVARVNVLRDKYTGQPKGFAFVEMPNDDQAQKAISGINGTDVGGRTLVVNEARPKADSPAGGSGNRPEKKHGFGRETPRTPPKRQILT
jgi:RNA recognition motif-containing protein